MKTLQINVTGKVGTREITSEATYEAEGLLDLNTELPAATAGELTTRTDNDTGVVTLSEGHGLTSGTYDVYWAGGGCRYGMTGTIDANTLSLDLGAGDSLPALNSDVTVAKQVTIVAPLDGDLLVAMLAHCKKLAHLDFQDDQGASLLPLELPANQAWPYADDWGFTNPLAGVVVATIKASCGDSEAAGDLSIPMLYDAVS